MQSFPLRNLLTPLLRILQHLFCLHHHQEDLGQTFLHLMFQDLLTSKPPKQKHDTSITDSSLKHHLNNLLELNDVKNKHDIKYGRSWKLAWEGQLGYWYDGHNYTADKLLLLKSKNKETVKLYFVSGNKIHCSLRDQSLSDLLHSKTKQKQNLKTAHRFQPSRATAVNISRVTVNCFPFDVIVFALLPAHGIWRETVSLLDVMWTWTSQWMSTL